MGLVVNEQFALENRLGPKRKFQLPTIDFQGLCLLVSERVFFPTNSNLSTIPFAKVRFEFVWNITTIPCS